MAYLKQNRPEDAVRTACRNWNNLRMVSTANMIYRTATIKDYLKKFNLQMLVYTNIKPY